MHFLLPYTGDDDDQIKKQFLILININIKTEHINIITQHHLYIYIVRNIYTLEE